MCHLEQLVFFKRLTLQFPQYFTDTKVLEVGSLDINGSIRQFFDAKEYIGIDVGGGAGVDVICEGQDFDYPDEYFDVSISSECFEHNPFWLETFFNMVRMTKSDGLVSFSCASDGRKEHGTFRSEPSSSPLTVAKGGEYWNYYRNLNENDFTSSIDLDSIFKQYSFKYNSKAFDLYFYGIKK
jgi:SAM-dependent methyltransferase